MKEQINEQQKQKIHRFLSLWPKSITLSVPLAEQIRAYKLVFKELDGQIFLYEQLYSRSLKKGNSPKEQEKLSRLSKHTNQLLSLQTTISLRINALENALEQVDVTHYFLHELNSLSIPPYEPQQDQRILAKACQLLQELDVNSLPCKENKTTEAGAILQFIAPINKDLTLLSSGNHIKKRIRTLFSYFQWVDFDPDKKTGNLLAIEMFKKNKERKFIVLEQRKMLSQDAYISYILKPLSELLASFSLSSEFNGLFFPENQSDQKELNNLLELHEQIKTGFTSETPFRLQINKLLHDTEKLSLLFKKEHNFFKISDHRFFSPTQPSRLIIKDKYQELNRTREKIAVMMKEVRDTPIGLNDEDLMLKTKNLRTFSLQFILNYCQLKNNSPELKNQIPQLMEFFRNITSLDINIINTCADHRLMNLISKVNQRENKLLGKKKELQHLLLDYNQYLSESIQQLRKNISNEELKINQLNEKIKIIQHEYETIKNQTNLEHQNALCELQKTPEAIKKQQPQNELHPDFESLFIWLKNWELTLKMPANQLESAIHSTFQKKNEMEQALALRYLSALQILHKTYIKSGATYTNRYAAVINCMEQIQQLTPTFYSQSIIAIVEQIKKTIISTRSLSIDSAQFKHLERNTSMHR